MNFGRRTLHNTAHLVSLLKADEFFCISFGLLILHFLLIILTALISLPSYLCSLYSSHWNLAIKFSVAPILCFTLNTYVGCRYKQTVMLWFRYSLLYKKFTFRFHFFPPILSAQLVVKNHDRWNSLLLPNPYLFVLVIVPGNRLPVLICLPFCGEGIWGPSLGLALLPSEGSTGWASMMPHAVAAAAWLGASLKHCVTSPARWSQDI